MVVSRKITWISKKPVELSKRFRLGCQKKHNFRNGSYIMEFFDVEKPLREILGKKLIRREAEELNRLISVDLFTVSDRESAFGETMGRYLLTVEHPHDNNMAGYHSQEISVPGTADFYMGDTVGLCIVRLVESASELIVSEQTGNLIRGLRLRMHMGSQFGNERTIYTIDGGVRDEISIISGETIHVKADEPQAWKKFINERQYKLQMEELERAG